MIKRLVRIIRLALKIHKRIEKEQKDYLRGKFYRELNYQLWVTRGARFEASERLKKQASLSVRALSFFSAYLIIMSIMQFMIDLDSVSIPNSTFTFITVTLSIIILILGQVMDKADLQRRSDRFHECALKIGKLYNQLRIEKSKNEDGSVPISIAEEINKKYQKILSKYENHSPLDYNYFRSKKPKYSGHNISNLKVLQIKVIRFLYVNLLPFAIMVLPALFIFWVIVSLVSQ